MGQVLVGGLVVAHGFITSMIGLGGVTNPSGPAMSLPAWFGWWPGPFGRSWLFDTLHLGSGAMVVGGLLWLVAGITIVAAGLGWLGVPALAGSWHSLALAGAVLGLVALALYFHPLYLVAVLIDIGLVVIASRATLAAS
jgi:hypothetical protein